MTNHTETSKTSYRLMNKKSHLKTIFFCLLSCLSSRLCADPVYHPVGTRLTFGSTQHSQVISDTDNPAMVIPLDKDNGRYSIGAAVGLGIEYDGNNDLFKLIDKIGNEEALISGADNNAGSGDTNSGGSGLEGIDIDINSPDFDMLINNISEKVTPLAAFMASVITSVNAKAFATANIPVLISKNTLGGTWLFNVNYTITTNLRGLNDPIDFDANFARQQLRTAYSNTSPVSEPITYDLSGGTSVTINPDGTTKFRIENNSGTITKAAQITELNLSYSRKIWQQGKHSAYLGIRPRLYKVGLSNSAIPIADIENAHSIFKALDQSNFSYQHGFGIDLGATYTGQYYELGATITNINEPEFNYPAADLSGFSNQAIINEIRSRDTYTMERQLKINGGVISSNGAWRFNAGLDINPIADPMGDDYQWLSAGANFVSDSWWLPGARLGARKNLAGSRLTYITAGLSLFNLLNLDIASTTDTVVINNRTIPRSLIVNLSMQIAF